MENEDLCDLCDVAVYLAQWMALQAQMGRDLKPPVQQLLRVSAELLVAEQERELIALCDERTAAAYLRSRAAGGGS
jgi:hypothetical protein